ncbi:hypothetical protein FXO38_10824 [Capsicum annuum]|uniref:Lipoxygenase domain-containing protein n=1 Tax=Capsicum annuum TaxID=4072 RepID=A0A2G2YLP0_CAPAN|nr:hypothetical protein FXO38_10824 [Capsicum annuum]PHT70650.1 hypothetical protein T459_25754 [Capsicum annuum]
MIQHLYNALVVGNFKIDLREAWLFSQTSAALCSYREKELLYLRGNGIGKLEEWDRDYDYNVYNDFGDLDSSLLLARPVLGEFKEYPYPRRGRIIRCPSKTDLKSVRWIPQIASFASYCPRLAAIGDVTLNEFKNFEDVMQVYEQELLAWLPSETLAALCSYREEALLHMRETGTEKCEEWDRVYDYDVYNNFGDVNNSSLPARPVLEGYKAYPYPRRRRTERPPSKTHD